MRYALVLFISVLISSCKYFDVKKTSSDVILNEELKTFNWDEVDVYPSFSACDSLTSKSGKKTCFERLLTEHIMHNLQKETIIVTKDIQDTLNLYFNLSENGVLSLTEVMVDSTVTAEIPNIKSLISESLDSLPEIFPAVKRAQNVKTDFILPIIIDVQ